MSEPKSSVVQTVWSIDNTIFQSFSVLQRLILAVHADDTQPIAVYAFEALGSSIILSPERVSDGIQALDSTGRHEVLKRLMITIGVLPGGIAGFVRKDARRCVPTYMLATGLKTVLNDEEIGNVLYEMLALQGLTRIPELRCSRGQITAVIASLSGFSDSIIPKAEMTKLAGLLRSNGLDAVAMTRAFCTLDHKALAEVYSSVFGSLQKEEVAFVSLEGTTGCLLLAVTLLWLNDAEVELCVNDVCIVAATNRAKLSIQIKTSEPIKNTWVVKEWHQTGKELLSSVIGPDATTLGPSALRLPSFTPIHMAREVIRVRYSLTESQTSHVGKLATGIALVALQRGFVFMDAPSPGFKMRGIRFKEICQSSYLTNILECMHVYGWTSEETDGASSVADAIQEWVDRGYPGVKEAEGIAKHPLTQTPLVGLTWILTEVEKQRHNRIGTPCDINTGLIEAAVHTAAESLYSAVCSRFAETRFFRIGDYSLIATNAVTVIQTILRGKGFNIDNAPPLIRKVAPPHTVLTLTILRCQCIGSILPGAEVTAGYVSGVSRGDLAYPANGYVAWVSPLRGPTTNPREAVQIETRSGYLKRKGPETDDTALERLEQGSTRSEEGVDDTRATRLMPFDEEGEYKSLPRFADDCELTVKHYWSQTGRSLSLTSFLCNPSAGTQTVVNWIWSIEAVAAAGHVRSSALPSFAELELAKRLRDEQVWQTVGTSSADGKIVHRDGTPIRYVTRTYSNEELRFFVAGRRNVHKLFIQHGSTMLLRTIEKALSEEKEQENERLGYLTDFLPPPLIEPFIEQQVRNPGWFIIT